MPAKGVSVADNFLIVGVREIHVDEGGQFVSVKLQSSDGRTVGLGLHPEMVRDFALALFKSVTDATRQGILPQQPQPIGEGGIHTEPTPQGVDLAFDLPDGAVRVETALSWEAALDLGHRLLELVADADRHRGRVN